MMERHYHTAEPVADMMARLSMPVPECGCHAWLGKYGTGGYAYAVYRAGKQRLTRKAATVAYELRNGPVPAGLELDHLCKSVWCVNADHLEAVTHSENLRRRRPFDHRTYGGLCKQGHVLPALAERNKNGGCPICYATYQAEWKASNAGYDVQYRAANKDRINAKRRERRHWQKEIVSWP